MQRGSMRALEMDIHLIYGRFDFIRVRSDLFCVAISDGVFSGIHHRLFMVLARCQYLEHGASGCLSDRDDQYLYRIELH